MTGVDSRRFFQSQSRLDTIKLALAFFAIYFIWGSTYLAIRYAVETVPPLLTAAIRHTVAGSLLLGWAMLRGFRPTPANWFAGLVVGALFFLAGHGLLHWAKQYVASGLAAVLIATEPMFILVLSWLMGQQQISRLSACGLVLGVIGVALLAGVRSPSVTRASLPYWPYSQAPCRGPWESSFRQRSDSPRTRLAARRSRLSAAGRFVCRRGHRRGISGDRADGHLLEVASGPGLLNCFRLDYCVYLVYVATTALPSCLGCDAHLCQSAGRCASRLAGRVGALDHSRRHGFGGDFGCHRARSPGRAACPAAPEIITAEAEPGAIAGLVPLSSPGERN